MSTTLPLSLSCWDYDRTRRVMDGQIRPAGITLRTVTNPPEETFFDMLKWGMFDVAEMSLSSYVMSLFESPRPFVAIPVFPSRVFRHGAIYVRADSELTDPAQLQGKVVGIPEFQMTAAVWIRGILAEHYGLPLESVSYRTGGLHDAGRTEKVQLDLPDRLDVQPIPGDATLDEMLLSGELSAVYSARAPRSYDPESTSSNASRRLFADPEAEERAYFSRTGIFPIMHTLVIRREVYEENPWVARSLFNAFTQARDLAYEELAEVTALKGMLPWGVPQYEDVCRLMGPDFWSYGLEANRELLATFLRYSHEHGLSPRQLTPDDLFAPEACVPTLI